MRLDLIFNGACVRVNRSAGAKGDQQGATDPQELEWHVVVRLQITMLRTNSTIKAIRKHPAQKQWAPLITEPSLQCNNQRLG